MRPVSHGIDRVEVTFDEPGLVANAGLLLVATLVKRLGLESVIDAMVRIPSKRGGFAPGRKVLTLVHAMVAGASGGEAARAYAYESVTKYAVGMRTRVTVSVDEATARAAEAAVAAGKASSVSAWVAGAMAERAQRERLAEVLSEIRAELGPATDEETAWARSVLGL